MSETTRLYESGWLSERIEEVTSRQGAERPKMTGANCTRPWPVRPPRPDPFQNMSLAQQIIHIVNAEHYPTWDSDMSAQTCACGVDPSADYDGHLGEAIRSLLEARREKLTDEIITGWPVAGMDVPSRETVLGWLGER